jgi:hypothetical protein
MEKQKNSIDNFFRESLKTHEIIPSDRAKEAFMKEVSGMPQRRRYRRGIILIMAVTVLLITGSLVFYYFMTSPSGNEPAEVRPLTTVHNQVQETSSPIVIAPIHKNETTAINQDNAIKNSQTFQPADALAKNNEPVKSWKSEAPIMESILPADTIQNQPDRSSDQFSKGDNLPRGQNNLPPTYISPDIKKAEDQAAFRPFTSADTNVVQPASSETKKNKKERLNKDWYFSAAVQYTPEWMFNTIEESKFVNNFGLEGTFTFGKYSIRTGLGLSITKGTNELAVEYNDYLGSYNKLDSMNFTWDGSIQNYIPTYYMKSQDVYDSLMKLDYPKVVKRYTYLQIPLVLGYDFLRSGRFSIGLRAGPVLSVLLKSKQLTEEYDPGNKKVISINNISPEQVSLNWQFMGGINASLRLSRNLYFEIEPMAKYYFNSVYEKSEITKKPWSIGVRGAFVIKLN